MSHPWFRVALVTLLALTDLIVYFYETGRTMEQQKIIFVVFALDKSSRDKSFLKLFSKTTVKQKSILPWFKSMYIIGTICSHIYTENNNTVFLQMPPAPYNSELTQIFF